MGSSIAESGQNVMSKGSRYRCLKITEGAPPEVASCLTELAYPRATVDSTRDLWMPQGFVLGNEHRLGRVSAAVDASRKPFHTKQESAQLLSWWLAHQRMANSPNADLYSTCTVNGMPGHLFIEAKAHSIELKNEEKGKVDPDCKYPHSVENHHFIGLAIDHANSDLNLHSSGWALSRDRCYQMSNRFAWAWKIASLGIPVVLVYLGFLDATEMKEDAPSTSLFATAEDWKDCVLNHGEGVVPSFAWGAAIPTCGASIFPLIKSMKVAWNS